MMGLSSGRLPSGRQHDFSQVPRAEIPRSAFNRSHGYKTTFDAGLLIPVFVDEALPGDTFSLKMTSFARLATPIVPLMDNMYIDSFFFAVPYRLVWDNWQKFNGEQNDPGDSTDYLLPQFTATNWSDANVAAYMGVPANLNIAHCSLWNRAYNLIWNEWFRDQNLQDSVVVDRDDGPDSAADYATVLRRGKRHDYFTSCLPWPQKGPAVTLPLGSTAPILGLGLTAQTGSGTPFGPVYESNGASTTYNAYTILDGNTPTPLIEMTASTGGYPAVFADLSSATASTINALRQAFQLQRLYERDARGGTRYTEIIRAHFGVVSPDARLQRPEYLGGGSSPVNVSPIPQTSSTDATTPQGNLAAMGTATQVGHGFTKSFTEHCLLIGLVSVRADLNYQQGLNRMWSRRTRWDFYWPALSHIGEQAVLNKEIYIQGNSADDDVFGYQERYAEYRYKPSVITGKFNSNATGTLDIWHLAQDFSSLPVLDSTFIQENPPLDRVIATPTEPHFLFDAFFDLKCARPMPTYSVPGLIDHF